MLIIIRKRAKSPSEFLLFYSKISSLHLSAETYTSIFPFDQELENQRFSINHNITDKLRTTKNACNDFKSAAGDGCAIYQLMRGDKIR